MTRRWTGQLAATDRLNARPHVRLFTVGCVVAGLVATAAPAWAQQLLDARIEEDNAQLAYWMPPLRRPDDEFANGTRVSLSFAGSRLWSAILGPHASPCGVTGRSETFGPLWADGTASAPCFSTDFTLAQEMYTPADWHKDADPVPGQRPYAGQLLLTGTSNSFTPRQNTALSVEAGVTGPPSLAGDVQQAWHRIIGYYPPLGWSHQIATAPEVNIGASESQVLAQASIAGVPVFSAIPRASVSAGNVLTGATAGLETRIGYGAGAPWSGGAGSRGPKFQIYALAAARLDYVWTELVLDRSSTDPAYTVTKIPWVGQYEFGGGVRLFFLEAEYRGVTRTREYQTGPSIEPYAAVTLGVRRGW
jgi:lipid A 3-O-deacylase